MTRTKHSLSPNGGKSGTPRRRQISRELYDLNFDYMVEKDLKKKQEMAKKIQELKEKLED